jgi:Na+-transporting methylmalonyl-CoA/oxaloacetate decarboxylase beta subunit
LTAWGQLLSSFGFMQITLPQIIMIVVALLLAYLAIEKKYEPLLLLPLAFGMFIANIPLAGPLIASPKSALIGLGGQLGIFAAMGGALFQFMYLPLIPY